MVHGSNDTMRGWRPRLTGRCTGSESDRMTNQCTCVALMLLLLASPRAISAQICLGRPIAAQAKYSSALVMTREDRRSSIVPSVGARMGPVMLAIGVGTRTERPRFAEWHGLLAFARTEKRETRASFCPLLRLRYSSGYRSQIGGRVAGADTTIEAGFSVGRRLGNDGKVTMRGDFGIAHHVGRQPARDPIDGNWVNYPIAGVGLSANVRPNVPIDASLLGHIEGMGLLRYGIGLIVGWPE